MLKTDLTKRIYGLDILRATAIVFVLLIHIDEFLPSTFKRHTIWIIRDGVPIFFALSGFLIGGILIKTFDKQNSSFKDLFRFWCNRWLRTIPSYYFAFLLLVATMYAVNSSMNPGFLTKTKFASFFVFMQTFREPKFSFYPESWSLCVEEWFYLTFPIVLFLFLKLIKFNLKKSMLFTIVVIIGTVLSVRAYNIYTGTFDMLNVTVLFPLDSLTVGVLAAYINYYYPDFWDKIKFKFVACAILLLVFMYINNSYFSGMSGAKGIYYFINTIFFRLYTPIVVFFLLPFVSTIKQGKGILYKMLTYTSLISYSLYLLHYTLVKLVIIPSIKNVVQINDAFTPYLMVAISYLLATIMYLMIEKPSMDIRKKIKFLNHK